MTNNTLNISKAPPYQWAFWLTFISLLAIRLFFFSDPIDEPHSWRQYDTAQYIRSLAFDGFDLLHPKVAWMGGHKTLILEFPLPEAITAILYKVFGENLLWARLTTLFFFTGAVLYFRAILQLVSSRQIADLSALIFLILPLGIPYSRAVHIDPAALCLAHAACYHALQGVRSNAWPHFVAGSLFALLAALVKVPYLFYLAFPILFFIWKEQKLRESWRYLPYLAIPAIGFLWWMRHTHQVNEAAPDWDFIPRYHKFVNMGGWYFSTWDIRFMPELWDTLSQRIKLEVMGGFLGYIPAGLTLLLAWRAPGANFMRVWLAGCFVYLLIFFPLNVIHNYYQLPFLAPSAFFIALAVHWLANEMGRKNRYVMGFTASAFMLVLTLNALRLVTRTGLKGQEQEAFKGYFTVDPAFSAFGEAIKSTTEKDDLIIASYGGLDCRAPHLLYEAGRYGWSIPTKELNVSLIQRLQAEGAKYLAVMDKPNAGKDFQLACDTLYDVEIVPVPAKQGMPQKEVRVYHLESSKP